jgi:hypothetical protein
MSGATFAKERSGMKKRNRRALHANGAFGAATLGLALASSGCGGPQVDVLGSYFPSWMACLAIGLVVAFVVHRISTHLDIDLNVGPKGLVYACLALTATLVTWLAYFRE